MARVLLMNPNSDVRTTAAMRAIAARVLPEAPLGWTATRSPRLIASPEALEAAADEVAGADFPAWPGAIIVAAFGDPGADRLAARAPCPVIGIGAAAARAASRGGEAFAVATTTPALRDLVDGLMRRHARDGYVGCFCGDADPADLMTDPVALDAALLAQIGHAHSAGARRVIVGGGPLGEAAERLRDRTPAILVNPVLCAAREAAGGKETPDG